MTRSRAIEWKAAWWTAVGGFTVATVGFGWGMGRLFAEAARPGSMALFCGNSVTDGLEGLLGVGAPVGLAGVVGLAVVARRGFASRGSVVIAGLLTLGCTAGLLVFGSRFVRDAGYPLSEFVWWLKPFGA